MVHDQDKVTVFQAGPKVTPDRFPPNVSQTPSVGHDTHPPMLRRNQTKLLTMGALVALFRYE